MPALPRLVRWSQSLGRGALFALLLSAVPLAQAPANDECAGAFPAADGPNAFSTVNATNSTVPASTIDT